MSPPHTQINFDEVEDVAPGNGFGDRWEARVARAALDAEQTGVSHFRTLAVFPPSQERGGDLRNLAGAGRVKLDDDLFAVRARDAIRVAPGVARAFEAGPDGLEFLAFGPHHDDDGEPVDDPWVS